MPSYDIFFFGIVFFLVGILAASFGIGSLAIIVVVVLLAAIFLLRGLLNRNKVDTPKDLRSCLEEYPAVPTGLVSVKRSLDAEGKDLPAGRQEILPLEQNYSGSERQLRKSCFWFSKVSFLAGSRLFCPAFLSIFVILGAGYYQWNDSKFKNIQITFDKEITFSGLVVDDPQISFGTQTLIIRLDDPYQGKIQIKLSLYPQFHYGDKLAFEGKINLPPAGSYAKYLAKKGISGLANFPEAELVKSELGSPIKAALFKFKNSITDSYSKILAPEQAAFLAGLIFGERGGLTKEFKEAMSLSGTTHLTALSGQNITVIVVATATAIGFIFSPFTTFIATVLFVLGFVAMTGFDSSAVRAAIMGFVVLLASLAGRIYNPRNSIALAAFLITLFNPKSLVFDVGFQLSFLAVLGIIYLRPALKRLLRFGDKPGFFAWRENLLMTLSAQLATAPILIVNFGNFSLTAFIANILILTAIPLTMGLGFLIGWFNFFSYHSALILGWLTSLFLNYEFFVINLFAKISLPINPDLNFWGVLIYYSALAGIIIYAKRP